MKVLTYNIQTTYNDSKERIQNIANTIKRSNSHIICLQEVSTPEMRNTINDHLGDEYYIFSSHNYDPEPFPTFAFVPTMCFLILAIFTQTLFKYVYILCSILFFPKYTLFCLQFCNELFKLGYEKRIDCQGLCVLISKIVYKTPVVEEVSIFKNNGYQPEIDVFRWFQITFLRPGYMFVSTFEKEGGRQIIVCNAHLAMEGSPGRRLQQAEELTTTINDYHDKNPDSLIILAGDMNSDNDIAIQHLNNNLITCTETPVVTWDCSNPKTQSNLWSHTDLVFSRQIDYIFCKTSDTITTSAIGCIGHHGHQQFSDHYGLMGRILFK